MSSRFFVRCAIALAALFASFAILWLALRGPGTPDARFATMTDVKGSPTAHWLPVDLPDSATDITISSDIGNDRVSFSYRANAQSLPASCVMTGANTWSCGAEDRYTLTFEPDGARWHGRIEF